MIGLLGSDKISIKGLEYFSPGKHLTVDVISKYGTSFTIPVAHTFNQEQIEWFQHGSALNVMKSKYLQNSVSSNFLDI